MNDAFEIMIFLQVRKFPQVLKKLDLMSDMINNNYDHETLKMIGIWWNWIFSAGFDTLSKMYQKSGSANSQPLLLNTSCLNRLAYHHHLSKLYLSSLNWLSPRFCWLWWLVGESIRSQIHVCHEWNSNRIDFFKRDLNALKTALPTLFLISTYVYQSL